MRSSPSLGVGGLISGFCLFGSLYHNSPLTTVSDNSSMEQTFRVGELSLALAR